MYTYIQFPKKPENYTEGHTEKDYAQSLSKLDCFKHWDELFHCIWIKKKIITYLRAEHSASISGSKEMSDS